MQDVIDLKELLAARWFAGKARRVAAVRHDGAFAVADAGVVRFAAVEYEDGGRERYLVIDDALRWSPLLHALRAAPVAGDAGRLELRATPALDALLPPRDAPQRVPAADQTNTLVALGERLLVKAYRRLEPGTHPEVELGAALAGSSAPVPAHAGSIHLVARDGTETAIALLQELVPDAEAGWEAPIEAMAAALREPTATPLETSIAHPPSQGSDEWAMDGPGEGVGRVARWYAEAGAVVGALHAALAERVGVQRDPGPGARWRAAAETALAEAARLDDLAARVEAPLRARMAALGAVEGPLVGRIHGDLHVAQLLRSPGRLLIVDFEGDPTIPLARRRALDTPLRDLASLLRSIDHVGAAGARRADGADPTALVEAARAAALQAYAARATVPIDLALLNALEATASCRELVYAHRVLPEWLYAARAGLERLLARPSATGA